VNQAISSGTMPLTKKFNLEDLLVGDIVKTVFRSSGADEYKPLNEIFEDFEKQENENAQENWKRNLIKELNELHTAGLSTADYFTQDLKETRFEKYFRVVSKGNDEGEEYYRTQYMKFFILYSYVKPFYNEETGSKDNFYKNLAASLEHSDDGGVSVYSFEMGLSMTFTLLDELVEVAPALLEKTLKNVYSSLTQIKTGMLESNDFKFYAREEIMNRHRDYLLKICRDEKTSRSIKELCVRLIVVIGNLRSSGEDYLIAYNLISENNLTINIDSELSVNKYFKESLTSSENEYTPVFKINEKGNTEVEILSGVGVDVVKSNFACFTFDSKYIYIYNMYAGTFKVGLKKSINCTPGYMFNVNNITPNDREATMVYCNGKLFLRKSRNEGQDSPLECLDLETLLYDESEEFKAFVLKNKRDSASDDWNKRIIEFSNEEQLNECKEKKECELYRVMDQTPIFTDGKLLYFITHWFKEEGADGEEIGKVEVETYCPDTWVCKGSYQLDFEPQDNANWTNEEQTKIAEDSEAIKRAICDSIPECMFATNGKTLSIGYNGNMYFFDLSTGERYRDVVSIPSTNGGYDHNSNTFWFFDEDRYEPNLKSFKIDGFSSIDELNDTSLKNFPQFQKNRTLKVVEEQKVEQKLEPRSLEKFLKQLGNSSRKESELKEAPQNQSKEQSLFLILYTLSKGCEGVDSVISELDKLFPDLVDERLQCQTKLFRSPYAVSISNTFVEELVMALKNYSSFVQEEMTDDNLLQQYQFLWLLTLAHRFMLSLDKLKLSISEVSEDPDLRKELSNLISNLTASLSEDGVSSVKITATANTDEANALWSQCVSEARGIQNILLNLTTGSEDELTNKINQAAQSLKDRNVTPSLTMFIKFLSNTDSIKNVMENKSLADVFDAC
jgi:hypothetical protein